MSNKLDPSFIKTDSTNLPKITVFMVWEYIVKMSDIMLQKFEE